MDATLPTAPEFQYIITDSANEATPLSTSTTFYPREDWPGDVIAISSDGVFFSLHKQTLLSKSVNQFAGLLSQDDCSSFTAFDMCCWTANPLISVSEVSSVFNLLLHTIYDFDPSEYRPTLDHVSAVLDCMPKYGMLIHDAIAKGKPLASVIFSLARTQALDTYALVAHHNLEDLAVETSQYLISVPLHNLTDEQCIKMGPIYLRRLIFLQLGRMERLKFLLKELPAMHPPTTTCDELDQKRFLFSYWHAAASEICWEIRADISVSLLRSTFSPIVEKLSCAGCQILTRERIRKLIVDWTTVKSTI